MCTCPHTYTLTSPLTHTHTHTHTHVTQDIDGGLYMEVGPTFYPGSRGEGEGRSSDHDNPDSFPWCLMNLCITKMVQDAVRKVLSTAGLEVLGEQMAAVLSCTYVLRIYGSCLSKMVLSYVCAKGVAAYLHKYVVMCHTSLLLPSTPPLPLLLLCRAGDCFTCPLFCTESDG